MLPIIVIIVLFLDQLSKYLVQTNMRLMESIPVIPHIFHLTFVLNPGAAFSMLMNQRTFFIIITVIALLISGYFFYRVKQEKYLLRFGIALQMGGAIGNLIDRIRLGMVVDFFDFRVWPVFNIADSAIFIGVVIICWELIKWDQKEQADPRERRRKSQEKLY